MLLSAANALIDEHLAGAQFIVFVRGVLIRATVAESVWFTA